mgnify:CR=1 FL=1
MTLIYRIELHFDFKGSSAKVEQKERELTLFADSDFQLGQVRDVLVGKMTKRKVDVRFLDEGKVETGQGIGLIDDLPPAGELVRRLAADCEAALVRLNGLKG